MSDRKLHMKSAYGKYWLRARREVYGFMDYDRALIGLICSKLSDADTHQLLEVAIGTGEPIARSLVKLGHNLTGIDISSLLIGECKRINPEIQCEVGDAEELPYSASIFDLTYCAHSTWLFSNLPKAISEMVRVTKARGKIVFDVMNIHNEEINRIDRLHIFENKNPVGVIYKFFKNVIKFILRRGTPDWSILVFQTPSDPIAVIDYLSELEVTKVDLYAWSENRLIKLSSNAECLHQFSRLIFSVVK